MRSKKSKLTLGFSCLAATTMLAVPLTQASTLSATSPTDYRFIAGSGEENNFFSISAAHTQSAGHRWFQEENPAVPFTIDPSAVTFTNCVNYFVPSIINRVSCENNPTKDSLSITFDTGDMNDTVGVGDGNEDSGQSLLKEINISTGQGSDTVETNDSGPGKTTINTGSENDTVDYLGEEAFIDTGDGNDTVNALTTSNGKFNYSKLITVNAGKGNDKIVLISADISRIKAGPGNDYIRSAGYRQVLPQYVDGESGNDSITTYDGNDTIFGGNGNDIISTSGGKDKINAGKGKDRIYASAGNDRINSRDGKRDRIDCGEQKDLLFADKFDVFKNCEKVKIK